jgi:hypothetical protein
MTFCVANTEEVIRFLSGDSDRIDSAQVYRGHHECWPLVHPETVEQEADHCTRSLLQLLRQWP